MNEQRTSPGDLGKPEAAEPFYKNWREGLIRPFLNMALVLGFLALVAGISTNQGLVVTSVFIIAYLGIVLAAVLPLPFWLKAGIVLLVVYALGLNELFSFGIEGDGIFFFLAFITLAAMMFAPRGGIAAMVISLFTFGTLSWLTLTGKIIIRNPVPATLVDWISNSVVTLLFGSLIVIGFQRLEAEYLKSQKKREEAARELEQQKANLENQVAEKVSQFKAVNEVGRAATSILDPDELVEKVVNLISSQFGYYYAALFLIDPAGRWAELKSATGEAGRVLKENKHRLEIGGKSMVGTAISKRTARVALDVGAEPTRFENPLLPYTRSEIALPLLVGDRVLGALDVESVMDGAFGPEEIELLQNMANQVSIALDNASLFQQVQQNLNEMQSIQRQYTTQAWESAGNTGEFHYEVGDEVLQDAKNELAVPLATHGGVIGNITLEGDNEWTAEQRDLIESIASQASIALENARLMEESQSAAMREHLIAEISSKVWSSTTAEGILRTAVQELGRALNVSEATIELNMKDNS